jgi:N6-adenosine-specific RNA methylase IME4
MDAFALGRLSDDIKQHGLREPIVLLDGLVLDGRNRQEACRLADVEPAFVEYDGTGDPAVWVVSKNLHRRHLTESQRAMIGAKLLEYHRGAAKERQATSTGGVAPQLVANLPQAEPKPEPLKAREAAAASVNVSPRSVQSAAVVVERGAPELIEAVEHDEVSVSAAAEIATLPKAEQVEVVAKGEREILAKAKEIRAAKTEVRREERMVRLAEISAAAAPLAPDATGRFPVIYADPPWRYEHAESEARAIENQYPTMALDEICALRVADLATDDAVLFCWATSPKLAEAMRVVEAWGFTYRTCMVWDKERVGMGYWARQQHELLLICTRGTPPAPAPANRPASVVRCARSEKHSEKPAEFAALIERMFPALPKVELFCRSPREGWAVWGNQSTRAA